MQGLKDMASIIKLLILCMVPVCLFGFAAFLIYKQVDGWGWFLLATMLIVGGANISIE